MTLLLWLTLAMGALLAAVLLTLLAWTFLICWIASGEPSVNGDPERDAGVIDDAVLSPSETTNPRIRHHDQLETVSPRH